MRLIRFVVALGWVVPSVGFAEIGHVVVLEGAATRAPGGEGPVPLAVDSQIELNDAIEVAEGGSVKLELNDGSSLMLGSGAQLLIDEATFEENERKGFSAKLLFGSLWANVKKTLSGTTAKFEVSSPRAVAGVRGTTFTVEVGAEASDYETTVGVEEGEVEVDKMEELPEDGVARSEGVGPAKWRMFKRLRRAQLRERLAAGKALRLKRAMLAREKFRGPSPKFKAFVAKNKLKRLKHRQRALELRLQNQQRAREQMKQRIQQQQQQRRR